MKISNISILAILAASTAFSQNNPQKYGDPKVLKLAMDSPTRSLIAKHTTPLWGVEFNCTGSVCRSTMNNIEIRFQEYNEKGDYRVRLMSGVYYTALGNIEKYSDDVTLDIELLDANANVISTSNLGFSREIVGKTVNIVINPAKSFSADIHPHPVRDAVSVRVTPHWIQR